MIEKMKFVSITGPREDIDRVVNNYLSRYEIHLENALTELTDVKNLVRQEISAAEPDLHGGAL